MHFAGVVFPDVLQTRGEYQLRPELPFTPGWEVAGVVRKDAGGFRAGQRVAAMPVIGGFAETVAVDADMVFPLPDDVPFEKGAALPLNYLTMHFALLRRADAEEGRDRSGARRRRRRRYGRLPAGGGPRGTGDRGRVHRRTRARWPGPPERTRSCRSTASATRSSRLTDGRGVDVVVDPVGGDRFTDSLRSLAREGRLVVLGFTGREIPTVKVNRLLLTNISVVGVGWGAFGGAPASPRSSGRSSTRCSRAAGWTRSSGSVHPLADVVEAVTELDERRAAGKVLLRVRD